MDRIKVENSSNIESVGYDPQTEQMDVEFKSGQVYWHKGVTAEDFAPIQDALDGVGSVGGTYARNFRNWEKKGKVEA